MEQHTLVIFYHPDNPIDIGLLKREAEIVPFYSILETDITSPQGWMDSIAFSCQPGYCVVVNKYKQMIVRLSRIPVSFFELREMLLALGYQSSAKSITWDPAVAKKTS